MREKRWKKVAALGLTTVLVASSLTGCRFGFASGPDDENAVEKEVPIDMSVDTFDYDDSLNGTQITLLNSKAEIQTALEEMSKIFGEKSSLEIFVEPNLVEIFVDDGEYVFSNVVYGLKSSVDEKVSEGLTWK